MGAETRIGRAGVAVVTWGTSGLKAGVGEPGGRLRQGSYLLVSTGRQMSKKGKRGARPIVSKK